MKTTIQQPSSDLIIRFAEPQDVPLILSFITALARYENMLDDVVATEESLMASLFHKKAAEVIIGEVLGVPIGFALFFHSYSTFLGKSNLYLEDVFIHEDARRKGYGKQLFAFLAQIAVERDCERLEWLCLNWNTPSIEFYKQLGAEPLTEWTTFRLTKAALYTLSARNKQ